MTRPKKDTFAYAVYRPATIAGVSCHILVGWFSTLDKALAKATELADGTFVQAWSNPK